MADILSLYSTLSKVAKCDLMNPMEIFRTGPHAPEIGVGAFSDIVSSYNTANHEASVTKGHPPDNGPAHGWVGDIFVKGNSFKEAEAKGACANSADYAEAFVKEGKLLPAHKNTVISLLESINSREVVSFCTMP